MKTIEERAEFYERRCIDQANSLGWSELPRPSESYKVGANDQKKIDIEKACKWLQDNIRDYVFATIRSYDGETEEVIPDVYIEMFHYFKRAMEKEL